MSGRPDGEWTCSKCEHKQLGYSGSKKLPSGFRKLSPEAQHVLLVNRCAPTICPQPGCGGVMQFKSNTTAHQHDFCN